MTLEDLREALVEVFVNGFEISTDHDGQIIILTGLTEDEDGDLIEFEGDYEDDDDDEEDDEDFEQLEEDDDDE